MAIAKERLDTALVRRGLCPTRQIAQSRTLRGEVRVNGRVCDKPGTQVAETAEIEVTRRDCEFVSRGGEKLAGALDAFGLDPTGLRALDVGASTGGFTNCLLLRGAVSVTAVDVGRSQLHESLLADPRVTVRDNCNFRFCVPDDFPRPFDLAVVDVSFISLSLILPPLANVLAPGGRAAVLVKPQFEVGRGRVGKGGVVRDPSLHAEAMRSAAGYGASAGLFPVAVAPSPIRGPKGNREFFILFHSVPPALAPEALEAAVAAAARDEETTAQS